MSILTFKKKKVSLQALRAFRIIFFVKITFKLGLFNTVSYLELYYGIKWVRSSIFEIELYFPVKYFNEMSQDITNCTS